VSSGATSVADWLVPMIALPRHGTCVSIRPFGAGAASAMSLAGFEVTRFIAFSRGNGLRTPNIAMISPARAPPAFSVTRARRPRVRSVSRSRTRMPTTRDPSLIGSIAST
jgi:hypothetical protein